MSATEALQMRRQMHEDLRRPDAVDWFSKDRKGLELTRRGLEKAETYWVSEDMTRLVDFAQQDLPQYEVDGSDAPAPDGFVMFAVPVGDIGTPGCQCGHPHPMAAMSWTTIQTYITPAGPNGERLPPTLWDVLRLTGYTTWPEYAEAHPPLVYPVRAADAPLGGVHTMIGEDKFIPEMFMQRFARAFWSLATQVADITSEDAARNVRRGAERAALDVRPVQVVTLRRRHKTSKLSKDDAAPVNWTHRWPVRGHWRNFWRPSVQAYRYRYVFPIIKGPEHLPLVVKDRVYALRR